MATITLNFVVNGINTEEPSTKLSPYSYQHYPKTAPRVKGNVAGENDVEVVLTAGRGRHYAYFKKSGRVEWFAISKGAFDAIKAGASFSAVVTDVTDAPAGEAKPKAAKKAKAEA